MPTLAEVEAAEAAMLAAWLAYHEATNRAVTLRSDYVNAQVESRLGPREPDAGRPAGT